MAPTIASSIDRSSTVRGIDDVDEAVATSTFNVSKVRLATESKTSRRYVVGRPSVSLAGSATAARFGAAGISVRMKSTESPARIDAVVPEIAGGPPAGLR